MQRDTLVYCNTDDLPRMSWTLSSTEVKLLHADPESDRLAPLIRLTGARLRTFP